MSGTTAPSVSAAAIGPLTPAEVADVWRFTGYPFGDATLNARLAGLSPEQAAVVRGVFLPSLRDLEVGIFATAAGLDTSQAAVFKRNPVELQERVSLFSYTRMRLCYALAVPPAGDVMVGLGGGGTGDPVQGASGQPSGQVPAVFAV